MASDWYDDQDDNFRRRGNDLTRERGSDPTRDRGGDRTRDRGNDPTRDRGGDREVYRAGDDDAHRNDRDMAFGNRTGNRNVDRWRREIDRGDYGRDRDRDSRETRNEDWRPSQGMNQYESSRFNQNQNADYGLGFGRRDDSWTRGREEFGRYGPGNQYGRETSYAGRGPKGYRRSDERIREEASEALEHHPYIDATEIEVDVKDGVVTLRGHIEDRKQKRMAEDTIDVLAGVKDVRNELEVNQTLFQRAKELLLGGSTASIGSDTATGDLIPGTETGVSAGQSTPKTTNSRATNPRH